MLHFALQNTVMFVFDDLIENVQKVEVALFNQLLDFELSEYGDFQKQYQLIASIKNFDLLSADNKYSVAAWSANCLNRITQENESQDEEFEIEQIFTSELKEFLETNYPDVIGLVKWAIPTLDNGLEPEGK